MRAADDLRALGVDKPDLRWQAALGHLEELRAEATRELNRFMVRSLAGAFAAESAAARPEGADWITGADVLSAVARVRTVFGDRAAVVVFDAYIPATLRGTAH